MAVVFVSHSTKDKQVALQVEGALQAAGHTVFVDSDHEDGIAPGEDWRVELFSAVGSCNAVVFLNSPHSQASQWCHTELALAAEHRKWVYAVNLTADVGPHPLLSDKQGIRLETSLEDSLEWLGATLTKDFAGLNASSHWDRSRGPYPGLRSFEAADAGVFFGRDDAVGDVIKRLEDLEMTSNGNLLALIGPSGSGKSSLVKAGVLPRLADRGGVLIVGPFEPGNFPTDRLVAALKTAVPDANASLDAAALQADGLSRVVGRTLDASPECRRALVVIDQVEYLGSAEARERDQFVLMLDDAMTEGSRVTLLLIARQDRLEDVQRFAPLGRYITAPVAILPIDVDGLRLAVEQPAALARMVVDPDLTDKVIEDATDRGSSDAGRALPLVAETLRAVYELATQNGRQEMTAKDYDDVGGVKGSIRRYAEQAEAQLAGDAAALDALLPRFVTLEDDEHPAIGRPVAQTLLDDDERRLVGRLQDVRLLTGDGDSVRIVHDRLIEAWPRLAKAVQARRKELLFRTQLERQATEWAKGDGTEFLLGSESTHQAEALLAADTNDATPAVAKYVAASRHQLTRRRRRRNAVIGGLAVLTVAASALAVAAFLASVRANESKHDAQRATRALVVRDLTAGSTEAKNPYEAALLAIEAESLTAEPLLAARIAWLRAETRLGQEPALRSGRPIDTGDSATETVAWNPAGTVIAAGNADGTLQLFDTTTRAPIGDRITTGDIDTLAVAWNPAGTTIATGNTDGTVRLFDATTRRPIGDPINTGGTGTVTVAWNPAGTTIATGNTDGTVRLFDATTRSPIGDPIHTTDGTGTVAVAWNPAGTIIATGNKSDGTLRLFDATTREQVGDPFGIGLGLGDRAVAWDPTGTIIAAANNSSGTLQLIDTATLMPITEPTNIGFPGMALAWNPTGTTIAAGNSDGTFRFFDTTLNPIGGPITTSGSGTPALAWNRAGTMIATGNGDGSVQLFDATNRNPIVIGATGTMPVAWNQAGTMLATIDRHGTLQMIDATTRRSIGDPVAEEGVTAVAWNPTDTIIATGNRNGTLQLFDATTRTPVGDRITTGDTGTVALAWNPAGTTIATGNRDGPVRFIDATTRNLTGDSIKTGDSTTVSVAWNPAGTIIATGNDDGTVRFFDVQTLSLIGDPIDVGLQLLGAVAWNPAGTIIAASYSDRNVRMFDATTRSPIGDPIYTGEDFPVGVAWNPAGTIIATGNYVDGVRLFDAETRRPLGDPLTSSDFTSAFLWNPAGTIIVTGNSSGSLQFFGSWLESEACAYLRTVMTVEEIELAVGIAGAHSQCANGGVLDLPPIPVPDLSLPEQTARGTAGSLVALNALSNAGAERCLLSGFAGTPVRRFLPEPDTREWDRSISQGLSCTRSARRAR